MTYNIKLNLSKLYQFHSSREPERESKSAVASRNHDYCQFRREEGKKKRDTIQLAIVQFRVCARRFAIRKRISLISLTNNRAPRPPCVRNMFASSGTMPRLQQLTSIFHQSHAIHGRTRTVFPRSLCAPLFRSFFLRFLRLQKK